MPCEGPRRDPFRRIQRSLWSQFRYCNGPRRGPFWSPRTAWPVASLVQTPGAKILWRGRNEVTIRLPPHQFRTFLGALGQYPGNVVVVSNEVGLGIIGMDALTRRFADELGWLNQALAKRCDRVVMSVAGIAQTLKG